MTDMDDADVEMDDNYDEEADSDFDATSVKSGGSQSSLDEGDGDDDADTAATSRAKKRRKIEPAAAAQDEPTELDSGDEATIKEHKKERRKQRKRGEEVEVADGEVEGDGWRARTRAMRERDKEEHKQNKLASVKGSTIDVDKIWEEMNRLGSLRPPVSVETAVDSTETSSTANKENVPAAVGAETITIKRTYKFAGEVHTEEKVVPKDSAEAKLWLAQQESALSKTPAATVDADGRTIRRPLRRVSRFDPNYSNLEAFKGAWSSLNKNGSDRGATGPKLNVVEKSKMDWAAHVDTEGLQEELSEAAKAKGSYLSRTDFLREVDQRREEEARAARLRGL